MIVKMIPFAFLKLRIGLTRLHSTYLIIFVICFPQAKSVPNFFSTKRYNLSTQVHNLCVQSDLSEHYYVFSNSSCVTVFHTRIQFLQQPCISSQYPIGFHASQKWNENIHYIPQQIFQQAINAEMYPESCLAISISNLLM